MSMTRALRGILASAMAAAVLVGVPAPALAASGLAEVQRLFPMPGDVVDGDRVVLSAVLSTSARITSASLFVDHIERPARVDQGNLLIATLDLATGTHLARVEFTDEAGRTAHRNWRFSTVDLAIRRLAGNNRVATAVMLSRDSFPMGGSATGAVIATSRDFPDGLAAAPLAAHVGGPVLLSGADSLPSETAAELTRAVAAGSTVTLLGGNAALSPAVATAVADLGFEVVRIAGATRADTASAIARQLPSPTTVFVTAGDDFAAGLSVSAPAARDGFPILLTSSTKLSDSTRAFLADVRPDRAVIIGGTSAVSAQVEAAIDDLVADVDRIAGGDRYATAAAVVDAFYPDGTTQGVAIASGEDFPDGLAGGAHAAGRGIPLLLAKPGELPSEAGARVAAGNPPEAVIYGGKGALGSAVEGQLRIAVMDRADGPAVTSRTPAPDTRVRVLDTIELKLDRAVDLPRSTLYVTIDGHEIPGRLSQGDFADDLILELGALPFAPRAGVDHQVVVTGQVLVDREWAHTRWSFTYRKIELGRGDSGAEVEGIQERLMSLGYWLGDVDGQFGSQTSQALMAFQKYEGLSRSGIADEATRTRLEFASRPVPVSSRQGRWVEIDKTRQVMLFILDGQVEWTMNTSTGTETEYKRPDGSTGFANTPEGWFTFFRQIDGMREAELGQLWRPKYFTNAGHAIHGSRSIPAHPASHGCARLSYPGIDFVWSAGLAPVGTRVLVHK